MLTSKEVYAIMKKDILELQRKRIKELEDALTRTSDTINHSKYGPKAIWIAEENKKLIEKGISL